MNNWVNKVQNNFNKASKSYDKTAEPQRQAADFLVQKISENKSFIPESILDLGTGTGYVPSKLIPYYPNSHYYLNDISQKMLNICRKKFSHVSNMVYLNNEMTKLNIIDVDFDLITSNLALQWVDDLWLTLSHIQHHKKHKIFAFSTLVDGTFQEWEDLINAYHPTKLQTYPTVKELSLFCDNIKDNYIFEYWLMDIPLSFEHPLLLMHYLKQLGASASAHQIPIKPLRKLLKEQKNTLTVSYKIFFGMFKKVS